MGEITEALRRANAELEQQRARVPIDRPLVPLLPSEPLVDASLDPPEGEVLANVELTHETKESLPPQAVVVDGGGAVTDICLHLALRIQSTLDQRGSKSLALVSALRDEGKTTVACNVALSLASLRRAHRVALVDLDMRRPSVASVLELPAPPADIGQVIEGAAAIEDARVPLGNPALDAYPILRPRPAAHEILGLPSFGAVVRELERRYDVVVFDTPPSLLVPDSSLIARHVGAYAAVARTGTTRVNSFNSMLEMLPHEGFIGAVLNATSLPLHSRYYGEYAIVAQDENSVAVDASMAEPNDEPGPRHDDPDADPDMNSNTTNWSNG